MDNLSLNTSDLDKLSEKDRSELQQFIQNENSKARLTSSVHTLTNVCFRKCVTGAIKNGKLDKTEESCMTNCTERFFDLTEVTLKHLNARRS
ncbi:Tim10/DDP family zinc finger protein [Nemania sp. NC0429]|nr:Tim10/DDP family zinc finger protein [Nemania sp. NC0429]